MEESDAARAASLLRGSSFKVPLQPDLEKKITEEEQERRRQAVQAVEASRAPVTVDPTTSAAAGDADEAAAATSGTKGQTAPSPAGESPPTSLMGKVVAGMGMGRFFGMEGGRSPTSAEPTAPPPAEEFKAGPADDPASGGVAVAKAAAPAGGAAGADYVPVTGEGAVAGQPAAVAMTAPVVPTVEGSLSPEQVKAYSENVDRTLEVGLFLQTW